MNELDKAILDTEQEFHLLSRKWKHRRRLAYIALLSTTVLVLLVTVLAAKGFSSELSDVNSVLALSITGFLSLVGGYMGLATWKDS